MRVVLHTNSWAAAFTWLPMSGSPYCMNRRSAASWNGTLSPVPPNPLAVVTVHIILKCTNNIIYIIIYCIKGTINLFSQSTNIFFLFLYSLSVLFILLLSLLLLNITIIVGPPRVNRCSPTVNLQGVPKRGMLFRVPHRHSGICDALRAIANSQMPRHLVSDAHEWINEIPTVRLLSIETTAKGTGLGRISGKRSSSKRG